MIERLDGASRAIARVILIASVVVASTGCGKPSSSYPAAHKGEAPTAAATPSESAKGDTGSSEGEAPADPVASTTEAVAAPALDPSKQVPLPDGTFTGAISGDRVSGEIALVIRDGVLVSSRIEAISKKRFEFELRSRSGADSPMLSLTGGDGRSFAQVKGGFVDSERASGTFRANLGKKRVSGRWYAIRR